MHIQANHSLLLASLGAGREEAQEIAVKRAAQVRRKLSAASQAMELTELTEGEFTGAAKRVDARTYESSEPRQGEDEGFGRLFSAKA